METSQKAFYVTAAISYPNANPHLGHAYELVIADCLARFHRFYGDEVYFTTGVDTHGQKIAKSAAKQNTTPEAFVQPFIEAFQKLNEKLDISCDDFINTQEERHKRAVQHLWTQLKESDNIYKSNYAGWYCAKDETYYGEGDIKKISSGDFVTPSGDPVEWMEEEAYFFPLNRYKEKLLSFYEKNSTFISPRSRYNEVLNFVEGDLRDLCISRINMTWGIQVPEDEKHVIYVWFDALINYLTALGYPDTNTKLFQTFWPANTHVVGKDITRFHGIIWPAILMALNMECPHNIFAHGFVLQGSEKMSKSSGTGVDPLALVERYSSDALRYFLLRQIPFGEDGTYTEDELIRRINSDMANDWGNLVQRCFSMVKRECDNIIPELEDYIVGNDAPEEQGIVNKFSSSVWQERLHFFLHRGDLQSILREIWECVSDANRYFANAAPWTFKETDPNRMKQILAATCEMIRILSLYLQPIMPASSALILNALAIPKGNRNVINIQKKSATTQRTLSPSWSILFPKF